MVAVPRTHKFGSAVDPIVFSSGFARIIATVASPITAVLIIHFLSLPEQGYWYTFLGLVAIVNYAELGMGQVILQFAAYEWGEFGGASQTLESDNGRRLKSIFRIALLFGGLTALVGLMTALPLGYFILSSRGGSQDIHWLGPWVFVSLVAPLNLALVFLNSFLEGCQMIVAANLRRAAQAVAQVAGAFLFFAVGGKLWALGAGQLASFGVGLLWILLTQRSFLRALLTGFPDNKQVSWRDEIWPLQWRYAAGWATGPFVYGLFSPLIFALVGSEAAGRFGFTFAIVGVVLAYSQVWIASRAAVFTKLNAGSNWRELTDLFGRSVKQGVLTYLAGAAVLLVGIRLLNTGVPSLAGRFLDLSSTLLLLAAGSVTLLIFSIMFFVRSFKEEPFVRMAWIGAILMVVLLPLGISLFQTTGASGAYLVSQLTVLPIAYQIYESYRKRIPYQSNKPAGSVGHV
ncbi:MAG TPA: hypothetical protein VNO24_10950 [Blastocatellia bacterium]|nr:hypothetical protein [Blastocatellia bacterium]